MNMALAVPNFPLFSNALEYAQQSGQGPAITDTRTGKTHSYLELLHAAADLRKRLLGGKSDLHEERIAILCPSGFAYVVFLWAIWAAGGIAVPLCTTHPMPEHVYNLEEVQASVLLGHPEFEERIKALEKEKRITSVVISDQELAFSNPTLPSLFDMDRERSALIIFTSGTTGQPKGAVSTHDTIDAQTSSLVDAWRWSNKDRIHHTLPLHHIHGIINALCCALYAGATVEMHPNFKAAHVWSRWTTTDQPPLTIFMSVPTVYSKLLSYFKSLPEMDQAKCTASCKQFRFMVSGSASLPTTLRETWRQISGGQVLLERYGMTEIGMGLSQLYEVEERIEGTVGCPLEGVEVRLMAESVDGSGQWDANVTEERDRPGEVQIKGRNVFKEYWHRPEATAKEFTRDGWFKTGDIAMRIGEKGYYQILGRSSTDIIKTGGEKVSALEIERELLSSGLGIDDVAVVGVPNLEWGQCVAAVVVLAKGATLDIDTLRRTLKERLAVYKVPQLLEVVPALPKNAMGKIMKKQLVQRFQT